MVEIEYPTASGSDPRKQRVVQAILEPGQEMPFQLSSDWVFDQYPEQLRFYPVANSGADQGKPVGQPVRYYMNDPRLAGDLPETKFYVPGNPNPVTERDWEEGDQHYETSGSITLFVTRNEDGWKVPVSDEYLRRYSNPNTFQTSDWAIFTVEVKSL